MSEFRMPSLGADMRHGTVIEWRVKPGDTVARGDIVAVVDTEKAAIEVEVFEAGVIDELLVAEGTRVPVGTVLARLRPREAAAEVPARPAPAAPPAPEAAPTVAPEAPARPGPPPAPAAAADRPAPPRGPAHKARVRASPAARALAAELGLDLARVTGTGPDGAIVREDVVRADAARRAEAGPAAAPRAGAEAHVRISPLARRAAEQLNVDLATVRGSGRDGAITKADVERAAAGRAATATVGPAEAGPEPPGADRQLAMRQAIAAAVARSKREIPHYYLGTRIDLARALAWLDAANRERPVAGRILPAALLLRATALALRRFPELNGFWIDDAFRPGDGVHLGVAVFLRGGGLIAPAILNADRKSVDEMMAALSDLVGRARSGGLRGSELTAPTVTVTNLGDRGTETVFGVIHPPQVAIIGFGRIREQPWAEDGMLAARPVVHASLAADHRASDGHRGSLFLAGLDRLLQTPEEL